MVPQQPAGRASDGSESYVRRIIIRVLILGLIWVAVSVAVLVKSDADRAADEGIGQEQLERVQEDFNSCLHTFSNTNRAVDCLLGRQGLSKGHK